MKKLFVAEFPDDLFDDATEQLLSDYPALKPATPQDVSELTDEVRWVWSSDELEGEAHVRVTLKRVQQGVQVVMPQWADSDEEPPIPCWIDLVPHAQDAFAPVQFNFYRPEDDEVAAKALVYSDGDVELVGRADMGLVVEPLVGQRTSEFGIGGGDYVLFLEDHGDDT